MLANPHKTADLLTFTKEILDEKFHFLYISSVQKIKATCTTHIKTYLAKNVTKNHTFIEKQLLLRCI